jgi:hypothetical protein
LSLVLVIDAKLAPGPQDQFCSLNQPLSIKRSGEFFLVHSL